MVSWKLNAGVAVGVALGIGAALGIADFLSGGSKTTEPGLSASAEAPHDVARNDASGHPQVAQASADTRQDAKEASPSQTTPPTQQKQSSPAFIQVAEVGSGAFPAGQKQRYLSEMWDPIHFKPAIDEATNEQCLACHAQSVTRKVREVSPAGVEAATAQAWYQTLDTYSGEQATFHERHLTSPFATQLMNLKCNFCHQGHDPREEAPGSSATTTAALGDFKLRKLVDPEKTCLMCHGKFPAASMGLEGSWAELREGFEDEETKNGCLTCHAEQFRTVRHQVNYLIPDAIEAAAKQGSSDVCLGCHGGRAWYRISYPYPRHAWPDMPEELPEWAKNRPTESEPQHRIKTE